MFELKKLFKIISFLYLIALIFFAWGFASGNNKIFPWKYINNIYRELYAYFSYKEEPTKSLKDEIVLDRLEFHSSFDYKKFKAFHNLGAKDQPKGKIKRFFITDPYFRDTGYLLISRYSKSLGRSIIELFSVAEKKVVHSWDPPFDEILKSCPRFSAGDYVPNSAGSINNNKIDLYRPMHPYLLNDGGLVFNITEGPLVRMDACGNLIWAIDRQFHHSVEMDYRGLIVAPIVVDKNQPWVINKLRNDGFAYISLDGKIIEEYSTAEILCKNGYKGLVYGVGEVENDRIHINDAQPIMKSVAGAQVGDIAISSRHLSSVYLFRPQSEKIIWLKTGPWLNQHDVDQLTNGEYSVFANDVIRWENSATTFAYGIKSDVYIFNPLTQKISIPYSEMMAKMNIATITEGSAKILANGDIYIEENDKRRMIRFSKDKVRWIYINFLTPKTVGQVHWSRYIEDYQINLSWKENLICN